MGETELQERLGEGELEAGCGVPLQRASAFHGGLPSSLVSLEVSWTHFQCCCSSMLLCRCLAILWEQGCLQLLFVKLAADVSGSAWLCPSNPARVYTLGHRAYLHAY